MNTFVMRICLPLVLLLIAVGDVLAATSTTASTDGQIGEQLSRQLYCDGKSLIEGNIGLLFGLILVFSGIWALVKGSKMTPALITIFCGALITALPSLVESGFQGLSNLLAETDITPNNVIFAAPDCSAAATTRATNQAEGNCTGGYMDCS